MSEKKYNVDSFNLDHTKVTAPFVRLASEKTGRKGDIVSKYDVRFCQPNKEFMPTEYEPLLSRVSHYMQLEAL